MRRGIELKHLIQKSSANRSLNVSSSVQIDESRRISRNYPVLLERVKWIWISTGNGQTVHSLFQRGRLIFNYSVIDSEYGIMNHNRSSPLIPGNCIVGALYHRCQATIRIYHVHRRIAVIILSTKIEVYELNDHQKLEWIRYEHHWRRNNDQRSFSQYTSTAVIKTSSRFHILESERRRVHNARVYLCKQLNKADEKVNKKKKSWIKIEERHDLVQN